LEAHLGWKCKVQMLKFESTLVDEYPDERHLLKEE
jgi:hypothetical protein